MTLGNLPLSMSQIAAEMGLSLPLSLRDARSMWLADVASGAISMSDFEGKIAVKVVATASANPTGTVHTFNDVDFGAALTGRLLIACVYLEDDGESVLDQIACTIRGNAASGADNGQALSGGPALGSGIWFNVDAVGTSGNVVIDWSGDPADTAHLIMLSALGASTQHDTAGVTQGATPGTSIGSTIDIPADGLLVAVHSHYNTNNASFSGSTKRQEATMGGAVRVSVGFDNHMNVEADRSVSASWTGSVARSLRLTSFT